MMWSKSHGHLTLTYYLQNFICSSFMMCWFSSVCHYEGADEANTQTSLGQTGDQCMCMYVCVLAGKYICVCICVCACVLHACVGCVRAYMLLYIPPV